MATKTSTEIKKEVTRKGDLVIVKVTETTTIEAPGKEPEVKEVTRVEEFKGEEGFKRLPEDIRRQLEQPTQKVVKGINKTATKGNFAEECLNQHNKYRKTHGAQPLILSKELMRISQERAKELAEKDEMSSRTDHTYGENVSCLWSSDPEHSVNGAEVADNWYVEHTNYDFTEEPQNLKAGHFTQMVWVSSTEFGVAAAKSDTNKIYVVATYSPPGNYVGEFKKNVQPAGSSLATNLGRAVSSSVSSFKSKTSAAAAPAPTSGADLNKECVAVHNEYRAKHGVPPLTYNAEVAKYAQEWAEELARKGKIEHRREGKYGENLYAFQSSDPSVMATAADACKAWYQEIKDYNFNSEAQAYNQTGHFSQMVWKATKEVGMGRAKAQSGLQVIVANYNPPGNMLGTFKENVPKPIK